GRIRAAQLRRHRDLLDHAREQLAPLGILAPLAVLDVGPFRMPGHRFLSWRSRLLSRRRRVRISLNVEPDILASTPCPNPCCLRATTRPSCTCCPRWATVTA